MLIILLIVISRFSAAHFAYCFHVLRLACRSSSLIFVTFAVCFLSVCFVLFGATSGGGGGGGGGGLMARFRSSKIALTPSTVKPQ